MDGVCIYIYTAVYFIIQPIGPQYTLKRTAYGFHLYESIEYIIKLVCTVHDIFKHM